MGRRTIRRATRRVGAAPPTVTGAVPQQPQVGADGRPLQLSALPPEEQPEVGAVQLPDVAATVPPHCVGIVVQLAHQYAKMWQDFARELDGRARIIDPSAISR